MRNVHVWKQVTQEGEKREIRASKFGKDWKIQSKLKYEEVWTYHDNPMLEDLEALHDILYRKYQRKRLAYDDVLAVEKMIEKCRRSNPNPGKPEESPSENVSSQSHV